MILPVGCDGTPRVSSWVAPVPLPEGRAGSGRDWSEVLCRRRGGPHPDELSRELIDPGPSGGNLQVTAAPAAHDPGAAVEEALSQGAGFGCGQVAPRVNSLGHTDLAPLPSGTTPSIARGATPWRHRPVRPSRSSAPRPHPFLFSDSDRAGHGHLRWTVPVITIAMTKPPIA